MPRSAPQVAYLEDYDSEAEAIKPGTRKDDKRRLATISRPPKATDKYRSTSRWVHVASDSGYPSYARPPPLELPSALSPSKAKPIPHRSDAEAKRQDVDRKAMALVKHTSSEENQILEVLRPDRYGHDTTHVSASGIDSLDDTLSDVPSLTYSSGGSSAGTSFSLASHLAAEQRRSLGRSEAQKSVEYPKQQYKYVQQDSGLSCAPESHMLKSSSPPDMPLGAPVIPSIDLQPGPIDPLYTSTSDSKIDGAINAQASADHAQMERKLEGHQRRKAQSRAAQRALAERRERHERDLQLKNAYLREEIAAMIRGREGPRQDNAAPTEAATSTDPAVPFEDRIVMLRDEMARLIQAHDLMSREREGLERGGAAPSLAETTRNICLTCGAVYHDLADFDHHLRNHNKSSSSATDGKRLSNEEGLIKRSELTQKASFERKHAADTAQTGEAYDSSVLQLHDPVEGEVSGPVIMLPSSKPPNMSATNMENEDQSEESSQSSPPAPMLPSKSISMWPTQVKTASPFATFQRSNEGVSTKSAEDTLVRVFASLDNREDLVNAAVLTKRMYRIYQKNKADLTSAVLYNQSISQQAAKPNQEDVANKTGLIWQNDCNIGRLTATRSLIIGELKKMLRPKVKSGYQRIEWTCSCGQNMFGDYSGRSSRQLESRLQSLSARPTSLESMAAGCKVSQCTASSEPNQSEAWPSDAPDLSKQPSSSASGSRSRSSTNSSSRDSSSSSNQGSNLSQISSASSISLPSLETEPVQSFLGICVNRNKHLVSLGEITLVDPKGTRVVESDFELFAKIRQRYSEMRRGGLYSFLYRPSEVEFVQYGIRKGINQAGIYKRPQAIPPQEEVLEHRYHYYECPMETMPPMDKSTFFHYFWDHACHGPTKDLTFYDRLPKKLGCTILMEQSSTPLSMGWGVHIIEGLNVPVILWLATVIITLSFIVSLVYDVMLHDKDSGFGIGQWMMAVLGTAMTAAVVHVADRA